MYVYMYVCMNVGMYECIMYVYMYVHVHVCVAMLVDIAIVRVYSVYISYMLYARVEI